MSLIYRSIRFNNSYKSGTLFRPVPPPKPRTKVVSKVTPVETVSYFAGKSIILFTMFYCTLNWMHYRDLRKKQEKENDKNQK